MLGLSESEVKSMDSVEFEALMKKTEAEYIESGADYVIRNIAALPELLKTIEEGKL
jgi:hypothetical protein